MSTTLRPYQAAAIDAVLDYWGNGGGNPLVSMATGTGKSVVIANLVRELHEINPDIRMLMLVHVKELVAQNVQALIRAYPGAQIGINSAGLGRRDKRQPILFASIQSVHRLGPHDIGRRDIVLIDEAHLVPRSGEGMYLSLLDRLRTDSPELRVAGFTATPYRMDSGRLDEGDGRLFDDVVVNYGIGQGIKDGYLSPLVSKATASSMDVSAVARRGGEFVAGALEVAVDQDWITKAAVEEMIGLGEHRRSWLAFCAGVKHAEHVRDAIRARGISCEMVTGDTPSGDRDRIIRSFKDGGIRCLTNAMVLTTGFDAPAVDLIAMLRPTLSTGLYVQICGRGTRLAEGKEDCISEGQRVLTDHGLVPIEQVTASMKVWDGVEFVTHCGSVFRGEREVIRYAGLQATPDHRVWTEEGWKTLGQCAVEQAAVAVTGDGRAPIRKADGHFRRDCAEEGGWKASPAGRMHRLRRAISQGLHELDEWLRRLSLMFQPAAGTEVAGNAGYLREAALHEPEGHGLRALWGAWHPLRIRISDRDGGMGAGKFGSASRDGVGPDRQRRSLRSGQLAVSHPAAEPVEQARRSAHVEVARIQGVASGCALFGQHSAESFLIGHDAGGDCGALPEAIDKTKRRVWDILDAGPRHSFTVEGILVHNCLVLDFAGNVRRHGPVDAISIETKGGGAKTKAEVTEVRSKECPACQEMPKHEAVADGTTPILTTEPPVWVRVDDIRIFRHEKDGKSPSMRIEYGCGMQVYRSWICFEHEAGSFPRRKAEAWWRSRCEGDVPATVNEAMRRADDITMPGEIRVRMKGKFWEVIGERGTYDGDPPIVDMPYEPPSRPWQRHDDDTEIPF